MITCVLVSHEKADFCRDAARSVLAQTDPDWRLVVIDSGRLHDAGYFSEFTGPRIRVERSGETAEMRRTHCLQGWCCNEAFRRGLVADGLVCFLPDDDVYAPEAFAAFHAAARDGTQSAWYGSADVTENGAKIAVLPAEGWFDFDREPAGKIDAMQVCCRTSVCPEWPEQGRVRRRADSLWLNALADRTRIVPIPVRVGVHRRTTASRFNPAGGLRVELGGGTRPRDGFLNVDVLDAPEVDEVVDFEAPNLRLPFADDSVGTVYSSHCLEHVAPYVPLLHEVARVCRVGASVELRVPHWLSDMALCAGHKHVVAPTQVRHWCVDFPADWWKGCRKRLRFVRMEQIPSSFFDEAKSLHPGWTDEQVMRFVPGSGHEVGYFFEVVPHEG